MVALRKLKLTEFSVISDSRFLQEAKKLINIVHTNIVQCFGVILKLMKGSVKNSSKNEKSDIYSFAVMMYEVLFPSADFCIHVSLISHMEAVKQNWRPPIPDEAHHDTLIQPLIDVMVNCWHDDPCTRLEASEVNKKVKHLLLYVRIDIFIFEITEIICKFWNLFHVQKNCVFSSGLQS